MRRRYNGGKLQTGDLHQFESGPGRLCGLVPPGPIRDSGKKCGLVKARPLPCGRAIQELGIRKAPVVLVSSPTHPCRCGVLDRTGRIAGMFDEGGGPYRGVVRDGMERWRERQADGQADGLGLRCQPWELHAGRLPGYLGIYLFASCIWQSRRKYVLLQ